MSEIGRTASVNPLLECCSELIAIVMPLRTGRESAQLPDDFRERILGGFDTLERMAFERQIPTDKVQHAKYALAAFIDEAVLASEWPGRLDWMSKPLQLELFGEHLAGEGFFTHLAELRQGGEQNVDVLELYYVCLQLGFEGIYRMRGLEQLMALQVDLRGQIDGYRGIRDPHVSVKGTPDQGVLQRVGQKVPYWVIASVSAAVVLLAYAGYTTATHYTAGDVVARVERSAEEIPLTAPRGHSLGSSPSSEGASGSASQGGSS